DTCSKEPIVRRYDHEVQGASVLKPFVGARNDGPSDAAVLRPDLNAWNGIILSNGINFRYGDIDPYWMAAAAIDEALRQIVAVGGSLDRVALLDNFCWGNTDRPEVLGSLVRAALACYDVAKVYGTPFISGKDSLHNEYKMGMERLSIPGTLLISAVGVMPDVRKAVSMDLKGPGNLIYIVGVTKPELGGSGYYALQRHIGASVPVTQPTAAKAIYTALSKATAGGGVLSCHDCSEGGLAVALAEMPFAGEVGAEVSLKNVPIQGGVSRDDQILFSESTSRFIVEVSKEHQTAFEKTLEGIAHARIGQTTQETSLKILGRQGTPVVQAPLKQLKASWQKPLEKYF
ncbi:MAG: phosphoribosylformylglycinamidine synthase, partial [Candidatus Omnitrophica bacterium]|nr:phosphoribosylformylglycinamidine synthase [Candidatus Omnitrophota bacterium]